ncbi:MAG: hypothetical protein FWD64_03965 [Acidobacteriaceae bacterium]|nr:hypothetical protein [Acidobacteriaceae bacterium]
MKISIALATAVLLLAGLPSVAQQDDERTGVSHPDDSAITTDQPTPSPGRRPLAKPSPGTLAPAAQAAPPADVVYGPYVPYKPETSAPSSPATASPAKPFDPDAEIVTSVPDDEHAFSEGTLIYARVLNDISSKTTLPGTPFSAELTQPLMKGQQVVIPAGSILHGRVTEVRRGRRFTGGAALHLEPRTITLPDGTEYRLHAQLSNITAHGVKLGSEGTVKKSDNTVQDLAVISLATGGGAVAGAMIGGGVGAAVGAGVGAGVSTYIWLKSDRQASLPKDIQLVFTLTDAMPLMPSNPNGASPAAASDIRQ